MYRYTFVDIYGCIHVYIYIRIHIYIYRCIHICITDRVYACLCHCDPKNRRNSFSHVIALGIHPGFAQDVIRHTINRPSKNHPPEFLKIALF